MYETGNTIEPNKTHLEEGIFPFTEIPKSIEPAQLYLLNRKYEVVHTVKGVANVIKLLEAEGVKGYLVTPVLKAVDSGKLAFNKYYISTTPSGSINVQGEDSKKVDEGVQFNFEKLAIAIRNVRKEHTETNSYICKATDLHKSFVSRLLNADKVKMTNCEVRNLVKVLVFFDLDFNDFIEV